ncbi:MAG: hypothetical protein IJO57_05225 [Bacilli bacterium]|nr:hypothetical protein [Bacilli bacterium]
MKKVIILFIMLLLVGGVSFFVINLKKEQKELASNMKQIKDSYELLNGNVSSYNSIRSEISVKLANFFYDSYKNNKSSYDDIFIRYNTTISEIDKNIANIDKYCDVLYKDSNVNKICGSYKSLYEKLVNIYVSDLNNYNEKISGYNEYKKDDIPLFTMIHSDYIDYDKDGKFVEVK